MRSDLHEANRLSWNAATRAHNSHKADQAAFFRNGGSTLYPEELQLLGHLDGLRLLHLQCNAGQDSLSLARLGARVTGVDIADSAIDFARQLSRDSGIAADFQRDDILRWLPVAATRGERFERVFASYGTLVWPATTGRSTWPSWSPTASPRWPCSVTPCPSSNAWRNRRWPKAGRCRRWSWWNRDGWRWPTRSVNCCGRR